MKSMNLFKKPVKYITRHKYLTNLPVKSSKRPTHPIDANVDAKGLLETLYRSALTNKSRPFLDQVLYCFSFTLKESL